jgi:uncharacterized protein (DUF2267 family)
MRYATFMSIVEQEAGISREQAERATRAVLETLSERLTRGEALDIAAFLPELLRPWLTWAPEPAERFDLETFLRRVASRAQLDESRALAVTEAVFAALGAAVAPGELRDMAAQLPRDYDGLLDAAGVGRRRLPGDDDLVRRVIELTRLDNEDAARATEAVLEVLGERISAGEVEDIEPQLPLYLRPALRRGLDRHREAVTMSRDEFIARVSELEDASLEEAERHVHAVFTALRDVVGEKEFSDVVAQLSDDYAPLLARMH